MPLKETIDYAIKAAASTSGPVRTSSLKLFATLYKHMGEAIKNYLGDVKESTRKTFEAEFEKVTPYKKGEFKSEKGALKGQTAEEAAE